jgi:septal ring factor EnvC (AmiA/AmiB activator)
MQFRDFGCRAVIACASLVIAVSAAAAPADRIADSGARPGTAGELREVRGRIRKLESEISTAASARPTAGQALKEAEVLEANARIAAADVQEQLSEARERERRLRIQMAAAESRLKAERAALGAELRVAYINGPREGLRLVLSRQDPAEFSRRMTYYGYLARQRSALLQQAEQDLNAMQAAAAALSEQLRELTELGTRRQAHAEELAAARKARALALRTLERDLGDRQFRLDRLKREARGLEELLARLERQRRAASARVKLKVPEPQTPDSPTPPKYFGSLKDLPLNGRLVGDFGQPRADGMLRWQGLMLAAPVGAEVRAVRAGRVAYSDYLPGMGQLLVIEHEGGYMSLYGHNQDLARKEGDRVAQGDVIAHVGDSGGEGTPVLYFELRHNGRPVNPHTWVR